ncbi:MAG: hypothetical protein P1U91_18660 [Pseudophaeobacter sp. bin_em_oilr2.035]|jgi:hypothetical protein|uniref:DoxX-like family protein n=1 Tax=Ruegeria aquimaris TaxID=2984333 RepID=A0ABT3AQJ5_9RHOB|nr:hypothetical protein [Ruegeria sp. XHP0148]MCV2890946.1 hypothetical protein [Ruegeria sp. XHP0148]MDF1773982.1 hypothetical protein [Pseudophaeobacter sp. bin_em_oilr2.035]TNE91140.1 MAG: hypothetical protein EP337_06740 [Paracoccaceae bacterium]
MNDKTVRYVYWIATGLVGLVYLGGAGFYISSYDMVVGMYREVLGYPTYIIWPLAILKIIGAVIILWRPSAMLAFGAHVGAGDPGWPPAVVAWILLIVSWLTANRVRAVKSAYAPAFSAAAN